MQSTKLLMATSIVALVSLSGCVGIQVAGDVQAGRNALYTGRPNDAVGYFVRAAEVDPVYKTPYRIPVGVFTYLGRAYYETGRDEEARKALEKAISIDTDDSLAHLYLGLTLLRAGDRERGRKEIQAGLNGIHETFEYITANNIYGIFWDPVRVIRSDIERTLAMKLDDSQLTVAAQRIGSEVEEEIYKARRDESQGPRGGGDSGGN
jgi:tetratricopeptide (TPR) repeat protein